MTMQMIVTNQKRSKIRCASADGGLGSHGRKTATAVARPPASTPMPISAKTWPLRMGASLVEPAPSWPGSPLSYRPPLKTKGDTKDGSWSWHLSRGRRRSPGLCGQRHRLGREHPRDRLDPADRRDRRHRPLDDLLVELGGPGLLRLAAPHHVRGRGPRRPRLLLGRRASVLEGGGVSRPLFYAGAVGSSTQKVVPVLPSEFSPIRPCIRWTSSRQM